jgi:hypothetical protein
MLHVITSFEFVGILLSLVDVAALSTSADPSSFPPNPIIHVDLDNTSVVAWCAKMDSASKWDQALSHMFAESRLASDVGIRPKHLAGKLTV